MYDVVSEEAFLEDRRQLLDLLIVLEIQCISDIFVYCSLKTFTYQSIPSFKIIIHVPGTYLRWYCTYYDSWMHIVRLNWFNIIEVGVS